MYKQIFIALGWNTWNTEVAFDKTKKFLNGNWVIIVRESRRYISSPMYYLDQAPFLNSVIEVKTNESPETLLKICQKCEEHVWRKKTFINGPRLIDIDILLYKNITINLKSLHIPHPRISERDFVIFPLYDLEPTIEINWEKISSLMKKFSNSSIKVLR